MAVGYERDRLEVNVEGELDATTSMTLLDWLATVATAARGKPVLVDLRQVESYDGQAAKAFVTEKVWVSKADDSIHVEPGSADHSALASRLTPTEAEALVRWNLSSVAAPGNFS